MFNLVLWGSQGHKRERDLFEEVKSSSLTETQKSYWANWDSKSFKKAQFGLSLCSVWAQKHLQRLFETKYVTIKEFTGAHSGSTLTGPSLYVQLIQFLPSYL